MRIVIMIKLLVMDVDGTLTDGAIHIGLNGECEKVFNVKDGYGIHDILPKYGIIPVIITARSSLIVKKRAEELGVKELYQGCSNKREKLIDVASKFGILINNDGRLPNTAYIGDDIPDLQCIKLVEISGCPLDAAETVKSSVDFISEFKGGDGAVREFIEWIILRK